MQQSLTHCKSKQAAVVNRKLAYSLQELQQLLLEIGVVPKILPGTATTTGMRVGMSLY